MTDRYIRRDTLFNHNFHSVRGLEYGVLDFAKNVLFRESVVRQQPRARCHVFIPVGYLATRSRFVPPPPSPHTWLLAKRISFPLLFWRKPSCFVLPFLPTRNPRSRVFRKLVESSFVFFAVLQHGEIRLLSGLRRVLLHILVSLFIQIRFLSSYRQLHSRPTSSKWLAQSFMQKDQSASAVFTDFENNASGGDSVIIGKYRKRFLLAGNVNFFNRCMILQKGYPSPSSLKAIIITIGMRAISLLNLGSLTTFQTFSRFRQNSKRHWKLHAPTVNPVLC